jgi:hypothetical protein
MCLDTCTAIVPLCDSLKQSHLLLCSLPRSPVGARPRSRAGLFGEVKRTAGGVFDPEDRHEQRGLPARMAATNYGFGSANLTLLTQVSWLKRGLP